MVYIMVDSRINSIYSFRQVFLTFHSDERYKKFGLHPHEVQKYVLYAMLPLAILAIVFGWYSEQFKEFVTMLLPSYEMSKETHHAVLFLIIATLGIAFVVS